MRVRLELDGATLVYRPGLGPDSQARRMARTVRVGNGRVVLPLGVTQEEILDWTFKCVYSGVAGNIPMATPLLRWLRKTGCSADWGLTFTVKIGNG